MTYNPAYVDAFRFINVQPSDITVTADAVNDTLTLVAGTGIALVANESNDRITVVNTGEGIGSFQSITETNTDDTYYIAFTRAPLPEEFNPVIDAYQLDRLYFDETTTPISYNPSTSTLTASTFSGNLTGNVTGDVSGNAGTVTNGVYITGSYNDPSWLTLSATKVGLGNVTNESKSTMFTDPTFTGTVSGVTATMVGLGNVTNESKATMFSSPTFTGTVSGVTATMVGLGNVTNESKATMFTSPTFTGHTTIEGVTSTGATGTGNLVFSASPTFTGTVSGVTATMVGLGNVTNESKATMFSSPVFTGTATMPTLNLTNALAVSYGGTGATSKNDALTNLLPTGATSGYVLKTGGTGSYYWAAETGASTVVGTRIDSQRQTYVATASQSLFTGVPTYTTGANQLRVYIRGVRQNPDAYTETSSTSFTLSEALAAGTPVLAEIDGYKDFTVTANAVTFSPVGNIAATNVQNAISELDTEKAPKADPTFTGTVNGAAASFTGRISSTVATGTAPFNITSTTVNDNLNADLLDSQQGTYYLDYNNFTNKPDLAVYAPKANPTFTGTVSGITATMVGLGNVTNESKATMFSSPTFTGTVSGVTATMVGLGNVTNESKSTMFTDPTFTGTVSGVTATMVGLGNVTNESKSTMFTDPTFTGTVSGVTKTHVGLGNVDNTADANKSVNYATSAGSATSATNATNATYLGTTQQTSVITGSQTSMSMSQDGGATKGSFVIKASGTGDANLAGVTFWNDAYAIKLGIRADGYFGLGGWSRAAWSWYSDPSGNMTAAGNVTAYSDPRLKEGFQRIENPLDIVAQLDGGTFTWKAGIAHTAVKAGKKDYGVLADQVEKVMPEIVYESIDIDGTVYKTVAYDKMVPVLIESVKALRSEIEQLKARLGS